MKTSGLVLDIYDDLHGDVVRSIYASPDVIPESVKTASGLSPEQRDGLPDDAFALVLLNNGEKLRKYACIDEGNTTLSVEFFLKTGHKLPVEAQKVAAANLLQACSMYGVTPHESLEKIALLGAMLTAIPAITTAASVPGQISQGLQENAALGQGGRIITHDERSMLRKQADVTGTDDMPVQAPTGNKPTPSKTVILKTAEQRTKEAADIAHLVFGEHAHHSGEKSVMPDDNDSHPVPGEQPKSQPQGKMFRPHVDVTNKEPTHVMHEKKAERLAAPSLGKYPLDNYLDVQRAAEYFDKYASAMTPELRREYCANLVPRADELGIKVSSVARRYGSSTYASNEELKVAYQTRQRYCGDIDGLQDTLEGLFDKAAEIEPELFAVTLGELDKVAGFDRLYGKEISDPYYSTFGEKIAKEDVQFSEVIGNDMVTEKDLVRLSKIGMRALKSTFDSDFAMEFKKDPVSIFKSMPRDQKIIIMRMANDNSGPGIELTS